MKISALSDLHGILPKASEFQKCDVVCIAGDICPLNIQKNTFLSTAWFGNIFIPWCESLPCEKVIFIAGNHDFFLDGSCLKGTLKFGKDRKIIYLKDSFYKYNHKTFYGVPYVTNLPNWAFNLTEEEAFLKYKNIPNCDVLITHAPPFGAVNTGNVSAINSNPDYGGKALRNCIINKNINLIICGHVHTGNHKLSDWEGHKIVNVSLLDENCCPYYPITLIEL